MSVPDYMEIATRPLFEVYGLDGHVWRLFEDGHAEGFPDGTVVVNGSALLLACLRARIMDLERGGGAGEKHEPSVT